MNIAKQFDAWIWGTATQDIVVGEVTASQLPGRKNGGPADAYRHVLLSAELTRRYGESTAAGVLEHHELEPASGADNGLNFWNNEIGITIGNHVRESGGDWKDVVRLSRTVVAKSFSSEGYAEISDWSVLDADAGIALGYARSTLSDLQPPYLSEDEFAGLFSGDYRFRTSIGTVSLEHGSVFVPGIALVSPENWSKKPTDEDTGIELPNEQSAFPDVTWVSERGFIYEEGNKAPVLAFDLASVLWAAEDAAEQIAEDRKAQILAQKEARMEAAAATQGGGGSRRDDDRTTGSGGVTINVAPVNGPVGPDPHDETAPQPGTHWEDDTRAHVQDGPNTQGHGLQSPILLDLDGDGLDNRTPWGDAVLSFPFFERFKQKKAKCRRVLFLVVLTWISSLAFRPAFGEEPPCISLEEISQRTTLEDLPFEAGFPCSANAAAQLALENSRYPPPQMSRFLGAEIKEGDAYFLLSRRALDAMWNTGDIALASGIFQLSFAALLEETDPDIDKIRLWLLFQNSLTTVSGQSEVVPENWTVG